MDDNELVRCFETADLTIDQWNHRRHVRVAWCLLNKLPFDEALTKMRTGLKALLPAFGIEDSLTMGYHETITVAWFRIIADLMERYGGHANSQEFLSENTQLGSKRVLRLYYSKERLVSERAKREFVVPDLAPLPATPVAHQDGQRAADRTDLAALADLDPRSKEGAFGRRVRRAIDAGDVFVVQDGGLIAYAMMDYGFFDHGFVDMLFVHADYRRRGHGESLMKTCLQACRTPKLFTSTNESNAGMQALLDKLGFERCGAVDQLDPGDPEWFYVFQKEER